MVKTLVPHNGVKYLDIYDETTETTEHWNKL
jgi:hypothetical protein